MRLYPLKFYEICKPKLWGGRALETALGKSLPPDGRIGESWELSDHREDISVVRNGALEGASLRELWRRSPKEVLGEAVSAGKPKEFPFLIKYIDASEMISVQVHPDREYAAGKDPKGEPGKNETWYVIAAAPGSCLVAGLKKGVSRDDFTRAISEGRVEECLNRIKVKPGDVVHIAAGTVHTAGKGVLLAEIQQTSDATYRIWDWGRVDNGGKPRDTHVEDALAVIDFQRGPVAASEPVPGANGPPARCVLDECEWFVVEQVVADALFVESVVPGRFYVMICTKGSGSILAEGERYSYSLGDTLLIPACVDSLIVEPAEGSAFLKVFPCQSPV